MCATLRQHLSGFSTIHAQLQQNIALQRCLPAVLARLIFIDGLLAI